VTLYGATGEAAVRQEAITAAKWILAHRALGDGGFRHDETDRGGPFLGDTASAGRAFLSLYEATGDRVWLAHAEAAARFIQERFRQASGFASATPRERFDRPLPQRDENVVVARFTNQLFRQTGKPSYREMAEHAFEYLTTPEVARRFATASVLLVDSELHEDTGTGTRTSAR